MNLNDDVSRDVDPEVGPGRKGGVHVPVPALVVICVALVGAVGFSAFKLLAKSQVSVPDIVYSKEVDARALVESAGLKVGSVEEVTDEEMPVGGVVMEQTPKAGERVDEGSSVSFKVSVGQDLDMPVAVPDLTGMTPEEAEKALMDVFLVPQQGEAVYSDGIEPGRVASQSVQPGSEILPVSTVTYVVSKGHESVSVPDVVGRPEDAAKDMLRDSGLSWDVTRSYSDGVEAGQVISERPGAGTGIETGSTIGLEVSMGPAPKEQVRVPNIMTYNLDEAKRAIESAGLAYHFTGDEQGTVTTCTPAPNSMVDVGSTVTFTLAKPEVVVVTDKASEERARKDLEEAQRERERAESAKVRQNGLTQSAVDDIIWEYGYGEIVESRMVTIDQVEYWEVTTRGSDGSVSVYHIDPDGHIGS